MKWDQVSPTPSLFFYTLFSLTSHRPKRISPHPTQQKKHTNANAPHPSPLAPHPSYTHMRPATPPFMAFTRAHSFYQLLLPHSSFPFPFLPTSIPFQMPPLLSVSYPCVAIFLVICIHRAVAVWCRRDHCPSAMLRPHYGMPFAIIRILSALTKGGSPARTVFMLITACILLHLPPSHQMRPFESTLSLTT